MTVHDDTLPILVAVFCDDCGDEFTANYLVPAGQDSFTVARAHMRKHADWETDAGDGNDYCPKCVTWRRQGDADPEGDSETMHVYPVGDGIEHETTGDGCVCIPRAEPVPREDGSVAWLYVHHSLDGREAQERAREAEEQAERARWQNFKVVRSTLWCHCERPGHTPHVWVPLGSLHPSDHQRVPPSLTWELGQFQDDARFIGIIPKPAGGKPNTPLMWCP